MVLCGLVSLFYVLDVGRSLGYINLSIPLQYVVFVGLVRDVDEVCICMILGLEIILKFLRSVSMFIVKAGKFALL